MLNIERRSKNVEVGIRVLTQNALLKVLGTWYNVILALVSRLLLLLVSCYLLLF